MASKSATKRRAARKAVVRREPSQVKPKHPRIYHAALDVDAKGDIVLRGRVDVKTLDTIKVDDYQREVLTTAKLEEIINGFKLGSIPDIVLGMRGERTKSEGDEYLLLDDVYVVDGLQRITAAKMYLESGGEPRLGATVHFGTTKEWEADYFHRLNVNQTQVSSNILLRNMREKSTVIAMLLNLCENDKTFIMHDRVCWQQHKLRSHLLTATTFVKAIDHSHAYLVPGRSTNVVAVAESLQKTCDIIGRNTFRANVKMFFDIIEKCWGISTVTFAGAAYLRNTFLFSFARVLSNHGIFSRDHRLFVDAPLMRKIKLFPVQDPTVQQLAGTGGQASSLLYTMLVRHINSGRRTRKLVPRQRSEEDDLAADDSGLDDSPPERDEL